ncbi:hypothetical protein BH09ACT3_BH09ACT3_14100 [soil metagenome]
MTQHPPAFDPSSACDALRESEVDTRRATNPAPPVLYLLWGSVYALGYLILHASLFGWWELPFPLAVTIFAGLTAIAAAASAILGIRAGRDVRGASRRRGMLYGFTWAAGLLSVGFIVFGLFRLDLTTATTVWLSSAMVTLLIGVLFAAGGAISLDRITFVEGLALLTANLLAILIGPGPLVLIGWLASCAVLFGGAVFAARRGRGVQR